MHPNLPISLKTLTLAAIGLSIAACSTTGEKHQKADTHLELGVRYMNMNRLEDAKQNLEKALDIEPGNIQAHNALAFLYEKIEKIPEAKRQYEEALRLSPEDLGVQNNYGRFLCERGEYQQGLALLTKAIGNLLNDRSWLALTNAGICHMGMGERPAAKTFFRQALLLNANYAPALLQMLKISYLNGEYWPAKAFLERYLSVAKHNSESLWYAMQIAHALGKENDARDYQNQLLEKFPFSKEAKQFGTLGQ